MLYPTPTEPPDAIDIFPRVTPAPSFSTCSPNQVAIQLTTTLLIPDYSRYYQQNIQQFQPSYTALEDGSLVTPPFIYDLYLANIDLLVLGLLTMLFARNIVVSGDYIRRSKVKNNTLFYALFVSQLIGSFVTLPLVISQFVPKVKCKVVFTISFIAMYSSIALLVLFILGYKAYKCLNNSRFVLIPLISFSLATAAVVILEMKGLSAERRLTGQCTRTDRFLFTRIYVMLQVVETLFICACFSWTVWKSRNSPLARCRISVQLSMNEGKSDHIDNFPCRRWDCVPKEKHIHDIALSASQDPSPNRLVAYLSKFMPYRSPLVASCPLQKPSSQLEHPSPKPPRHSTIRISDGLPSRPASNQSHEIPSRQTPSPAPPASLNSRISRLIPRMELFRNVMRDELCYTTFITGSCVVVAIMVFIGVNLPNELSVSGWISLNWSIISLIAIHTFGRVIRRHEKEAALQEPGSWMLPFSPPQCTTGRNQLPRGHFNNTSSIRRVRRMIGHEDLSDRGNPFSDTRALTQSRTSWDSRYVVSSHDSSVSISPQIKSSFLEHTSDMPAPLPSLLLEDLPFIRNSVVGSVSPGNTGSR